MSAHEAKSEARFVAPAGAEDLLRVEDLSKRYQVAGGLAGLVRGRATHEVHAVERISFSLRRGESLGIAGESGSGKTTTAKLLLKLLQPSEGTIVFDGKNLGELSRAELKAFRSRAQLMFQNPYEALNPRFTIYRSLAEPLRIHDWDVGAEIFDRVLETLEQVNLRPAEFFLDKYPHQLSGGQLQRAVLARALVLRPEFLVADEPVSMLDVSLRAGILNTMRTLARTMNLTSVYISHDLSLLQYTCDRIAVMYRGRIVELAPARSIIQEPRHPYTRALVSAVPVPDPVVQRSRPRLVEAPLGGGGGGPACPFEPRCPDAMEACVGIDPPQIEVAPEHSALCHLYGEFAHSPKQRPPDQGEREQP